VLVAFFLLSGAIVVALWVVEQIAAPSDELSSAGVNAPVPVSPEVQRPAAPLAEAAVWSPPPDLGAAEWRALAAARVRRFLDLTGAAALADDPAHRRLATWAVFSAYRDCVALGLEDEARALLRTRPTSATAPATGRSES